MDDLFLKIVGSLALAVAALALVMIRHHGKTCKELQATAIETFVPRPEFNQTTQALRNDFTRITDSLRDEIRSGYQHVENRIDAGNRATHERIDRLAERREIVRPG